MTPVWSRGRRGHDGDSGKDPGRGRARQLLETTDLSIDHVASSSGLGTAANLRLRLDEELGVTPSDYRRRFARSA